jgi:hypothetical protein
MRWEVDGPGADKILKIVPFSGHNVQIESVISKIESQVQGKLVESSKILLLRKSVIRKGFFFPFSAHDVQIESVIAKAESQLQGGMVESRSPHPFLAYGTLPQKGGQSNMYLYSVECVHLLWDKQYF